MNFLQTSFTLFLSLAFISCGESTTESPIADVSSISIDDTNISIYSTDSQTPVTGTVTYTDGSTANATADLAWSSSDTSTLLTSVGNILAAKNGGDANLTIDYASTFSDMQSVHIHKLLDINVSNYSDVNISDTGTPQTIYFTGSFDNNETNITLETNIKWISDENSTISEVNSTQLTFSVDNNDTKSILLRAFIFVDTANSED
ncbi:MAG: hypothetical protein U9N39_01185, partial [Campylobacterota bacterium]|nr:hypothetical protein [Campylobacterota bacterium]